MRYWEIRHISQFGPLDGVSLPKQCARLADLLGAMWFAREDLAEIPDGCEIASLIAQSKPGTVHVG